MQQQCLLLFFLFSSLSAGPTFSPSWEATTQEPEVSSQSSPSGTTPSDEQTDRDDRFEADVQQIRQQCTQALQRTHKLESEVSALKDNLARSRTRQTSLERALMDAGASRAASANRMAQLEAELTALKVKSSKEAAERQRDARSQTEALRKLREEFYGLSALSSGFARYMNATFSLNGNRMKNVIGSLKRNISSTKAKLEQRLKGLETRLKASELQLSMWNVSRTLQKCQKAKRDERQDAELEVLKIRTRHLVKAADGLRNLTNTLQSILYDNNRITNSLTNFKNRARSAIDSLVLNMAHLAKTLPKSCSSEIVESSSSNEILLIVPNFHAGEMRATQCVFTDRDSWTVIQQRDALDLDFNRRWIEYENGFGEAEGDYWLGLRLIHNIVASGKWKLRVDLWDAKGRYFYAVYRHFSVGPRGTNYRLQVGGYYGNASDTLARASGFGFSAPDRDADGTAVHCAQFEEAGWWMAHCHDSNLNGKKPFGIIWYHTPLKDYLRLRKTRMMVAPATAADLVTTAPLTTQAPRPEVRKNATWEELGNSTEPTDVEAATNSTEAPDDVETSQNSTNVREEYDWAMNRTEENEPALVESSATTNMTINLPLPNGTSSPYSTNLPENVTQSSGKEASSLPTKGEKTTPNKVPPAQTSKKVEDTTQKKVPPTQTSEKTEKEIQKVPLTQTTEKTEKNEKETQTTENKIPSAKFPKGDSESEILH